MNDLVGLVSKRVLSTHQLVDALLYGFVVSTKLLTALGVVAICATDDLSCLLLDAAS